MEAPADRKGRGSRTKHVRRLKPEVAAQWAARRDAAELGDLFDTPVDQLSPDDLARMKAAFLRG